MNNQILNSLYNRVSHYDMGVLKTLYDHRGEPVAEVINQLECPLSEEHIKLRYFKHSKSQLIKGNSAGTAFNYFRIIGGVVKINAYKEAELQWVLNDND